MPSIVDIHYQDRETAQALYPALAK